MAPGIRLSGRRQCGGIPPGRLQCTRGGRVTPFRSGNRTVMMTTLASAVTEGTRRRMVLIDFDWQDADLLPRLMQRPGVSVRLVAGERTEDAGLRMAEVCGLPRTLDLADLTREIFDMALVSDRSVRRARVQSLL